MSLTRAVPKLFPTKHQKEVQALPKKYRFYRLLTVTVPKLCFPEFLQNLEKLRRNYGTETKRTVDGIVAFRCKIKLQKLLRVHQAHTPSLSFNVLNLPHTLHNAKITTSTCLSPIIFSIQVSFLTAFSSELLYLS